MVQLFLERLFELVTDLYSMFEHYLVLRKILHGLQFLKDLPVRMELF